jgi:hypothetical protein
MSPRPEALSLQEMQSAFAAALRTRVDGQPNTTPDVTTLARELHAAPQAIPAVDRLAVYRNNAGYFFRTALERTYRVLHRRVGDDYFRQLAHEYRAQHPSTRGDLHWIGQAFPTWLAKRLDGTDYAWLPDLARLEWACESAWAAADAAPVALAVLAEFPPDELGSLVFELHPSVRFVASQYPVWSVWQANQGDEPAGPADLATGAEHCVVACGADRVVVFRVAADDFGLLERLAQGVPLGEAVAALGYDLDGLPALLAWLFNEQLVAGLRLR